MARGLDPATAERAALKALGAVVHRQAAIVAFSRFAFMWLRVVLMGSSIALFLLPKIKPGNEAHAAGVPSPYILF